MYIYIYIYMYRLNRRTRARGIDIYHVFLISGCAICQNYMFSGEPNTLPFFRRLKQI